ncbi:MAG TPA: hypothetical protein VF396_25995 [Bradyrhizobium sp.]
MESDIETLTTCEVAADGGAISLGFVDAAGCPATVTLSLNDAGSLAMTLPGLITKALQTRFGDWSLYYAYPLASWAIEQSSDPAQVLVTLRTADGFSACFSLQRQQRNEFGEALLAEPASRAAFH